MIQIFINENYANGHKIYSFMKIVGIWNLLSFLWWIWVCYEYNTIKWRREYLFMLIMSSCWMLSNVKSLFMEMRKILPPSILRNLLKSEFDSFEKFLWTWFQLFFNPAVMSINEKSQKIGISPPRNQRTRRSEWITVFQVEKLPLDGAAEILWHLKLFVIYPHGEKRESKTVIFYVDYIKYRSFCCLFFPKANNGSFRDPLLSVWNVLGYSLEFHPIFPSFSNFPTFMASVPLGVYVQF